METYNYCAGAMKCPSNIKPQNMTSVSEFLLIQLSEDPELQPVLFGMFLSMYIVTVLGNLLIILTISWDSHLHTPMYFFLSNLSLADICFISTTVPNMIVHLQNHVSIISYVDRLTQMSIFIIFGCMDSLFIALMAYDQFVAICYPMHYSIIMNLQLCALLVFVSFLFSLLDSQVHNLIVLQFSYFKNVEISNFFCDPSELLSLGCSEAFIINIIMYFIIAISGFLPISGIFFSYFKIVSSILRIPPTDKKFKPFSTYGSHLSNVCLFYGTCLGVYLSSAVSHSPRNGVVASIRYTVVTPMLNPFIYSLRNRGIKNALRKNLRRTL
ncbi:olfactory receptor 7E178-like [Castor canadensis]|uniref:Olfactory receptor 7E178-like n=1 Tax=Castor canadensis TaxID=51338 RepID=A0AC58KWT4_CASCN